MNSVRIQRPGPGHVHTRGVHGYTDEGGELKNKWKGVFEEALVK